jgi:hypothetical protein
VSRRHGRRKREPERGESVPVRLVWTARLEAAARAALFLAAFLALCPLRWHATVPGLDPFWAYALNDAHHRGLVFGRDLALTYGPWAWLILPMVACRNLGGALAFQAASWLTFGLVLGWIVLRWKAPLAGVALFVAMATYGRPALFSFGYAGPDHFLILLVVLSLGCVAVARRREPFAAVAVLATALLALIKTSSAILAVSVLAGFAFLLWLAEGRRAVPVLLIAACTPLLFVLAYSLHSASPADLAGYVRHSMDIASAYSVTNSLPADQNELSRALVVLAAAVLLTAALRFPPQPSFWLALSLSGAWLLELEHGFVRADAGHTGIFFSVGALLLGAVMLLSRPSGRSRWLLGGALALVL